MASKTTASASTTSAPTIDSLLTKGDGVLIKRGGVWTYPGAPNDPSGTNVIMLAEFLSDAVVQEAIGKGDLVTKTTDVIGNVVAVTGKPADGEIVRIVNMAQAGSVEAATELPLNSRPTHDAGRNSDTVDVAVAQGAVPVATAASGPVAAAVPVAATPASGSTTGTAAS